MNIALCWPLMFIPQVGHQVGVCSLMLGLVNLIPMPASDGLRIWRNLVGSQKARSPMLRAAVQVDRG
jgi:Zn-dependent protease